jgi:hypothetical protein
MPHSGSFFSFGGFDGLKIAFIGLHLEDRRGLGLRQPAFASDERFSI